MSHYVVNMNAVSSEPPKCEAFFTTCLWICTWQHHSCTSQALLHSQRGMGV